MDFGLCHCYCLGLPQCEFNGGHYWCHVDIPRALETVAIAILKKSMASFGIEHTDLIIRQDSFDLKTTILSEIDKRSAAVNDKDLTIRALNNELARYQP